MTPIFACTTKDASGHVRHWYSDTRDCLPPEARDFRVFQWTGRLPWTRILAAIKEVEAQGLAVTWQVAGRYYDSDLHPQKEASHAELGIHPEMAS